MICEVPAAMRPSHATRDCVLEGSPPRNNGGVERLSMTARIRRFSRRSAPQPDDERARADEGVERVGVLRRPAELKARPPTEVISALLAEQEQAVAGIPRRRLLQER